MLVPLTTAAMTSLSRVITRVCGRRCRLSALNSGSRKAHSASQSEDNLELFRQINKYASEGKWDSINNAPKVFLFSKDRAAVYEVYHRLLGPDAGFFQRTPLGPILKAVFRIGLAIAAIWLAVDLYEFSVPEEYRLKYKYRDRTKEHHDH
ncbi:hypothetical protein AB6A40_008140 [Gnathostoma spinigerum]|uniref:Uncharacterized protein n=1 Tax=Gnathostoma spinigerum TaxID=75299 RepID=A0ABD6EVD7_9BILA